MSSFNTRKTAASRYSSLELKTFPKNEALPKSNSMVKTEQNFASMVKKFMEKKTKLGIIGDNNRAKAALKIGGDIIVGEDIKKCSRKGSSNLSDVPKKLFGKGDKNKVKALTDVKTNTRTLAMVLRSERELLTLNKDQESHISHLNSLLQDRTLEVEKLKNLCLKQREEIKALKSAILFPDEMNTQLRQLLEKQGSVSEAKQVIPSLQRQISSLTGQLQCLSDDLAQVKAVKYTDANFGSPTKLVYHDQHQPPNSLDFSDDPTTPDSPDDMLLKDVNPCLTPSYSKMKSKEYGLMGCVYNDRLHQLSRESNNNKLSTSSDQFRSLTPGSSTTRPNFRRSDESKYRYGKPN